jgi:8-oxo-dGTP pyrophosphatase MutT (NUDIX family)
MNAWVLRRQAARVVLINDLDQVFLIQAVDPADQSKPPWWEIPGGGRDPGEPSEETAHRELREEAGITDAEVGPVVWIQHVEFEFGGYHFDQDEVIHVARTTEREIRRPQGLEYLEALAFRDARWWTLEEVQAAGADGVAFLPPGLPQLLPQLIEGPLPDPPLDISPE